MRLEALDIFVKNNLTEVSSSGRFVGMNDSTVSPAPPIRPLHGIRILSLEQMQALPYATQLLSRLGADVIKIESPGTGDLGRGSLPAVLDPEGRRVGATFLRNNFNKQSIVIDLKQPEGIELVLAMAPRFDVVTENLKAGSADRLGLGYSDVAAAHPKVIYTSISGFGASGSSPYDGWPALAPVIEAMSGIYEFSRRTGSPPKCAPMGGLGDIVSGMFAVIGILAALRQRDLTGDGQRVDIAMLDCLVAVTDVVMNLHSLGNAEGDVGPMILDGFAASDGYFVLQVTREQHFAKLAELIGHPGWLADSRLADRTGWVEHLEDVIRPAVESWAAGLTRAEACAQLAAAGVASGPSFRSAEVVQDAHLRSRNMIVEMDRTDGAGPPVLVPGNPVKLLGVPELTDSRVPWLGEHTDVVLSDELALSADEIAQLRSSGVVA
jgi:formyl-CoA transferase